MVDKDSHSTDLSVLGEEGHSTILLATLVSLQNCTKMLRNPTFVGYNLNLLASDQKRFWFFQTSFEQLLLQKATFDSF